MDQNGIDSIINDVSDQAAAWYTVFTGKPAVLGPISAAQVAATQAPAASVPTVATVSAQIGAVDYSSLLGIALVVVIAVVFLKR